MSTSEPLHQLITTASLLSSTTRLATLSPPSPWQPDTVNWTVSEEAVLHLYILSLAVLAAVSRGGVCAAPGASLGAIAAGDAAVGPFGPLGPSTMHWAKVCVALLDLHDISGAVKLCSTFRFALSHSTLPPTLARAGTLCPGRPVRPGIGFGKLFQRFVATEIIPAKSEPELLEVLARLAALAGQFEWCLPVFTGRDLRANHHVHNQLLMVNTLVGLARVAGILY